MARTRTIKPEFFAHAELYDAEQATGLPLRIAFAGLWCQADREGRFAWKPRELKLGVLPHDPLDFADVLDALDRFGFVESYVVAGKRYGVIPTFKAHQHCHIKEAPSRHPAPSEAEHEPESVTSLPATANVTAPGKHQTSTVLPPVGDRSSTSASTSTSTSNTDSVLATSAGALLNRFPLTGGARAAVSEFFEGVPDGQEDSWAAIVAGCFDGLGLQGMRPASGEAIAAACLDLRAKGVAYEPTLFRRFVDRAVRESARPIAQTGRSVPTSRTANTLRNSAEFASEGDDAA